MKEEKGLVLSAPPPVCTSVTPRSAISPSKTLSPSLDDPSHLLNGQPIKEESRQSNSPQNGTVGTPPLERDGPEHCDGIETVANDAGKTPKDNDKRIGSGHDCFKTPALPSQGKKTKYPSKKRQQKTTAADTCNNHKGIPRNGIHNQLPEIVYSDEELLREFVRIGKHSFLCPRSQQFLARRYPGLELRKATTANGNDNIREQQEDTVTEIVIDEFSLLLFRSLDDYNALKEREDEIKAEEETQEKQRRYEENLRLGKVKKKGRKSKAELKREKKEAKKKERQEKREQRRQEREERRQRRMGTIQAQDDKSNAEEQQEKKRQRKEAKADRREEKKRQKQAKRAEEKQQRLKRLPKQLGAAGSCLASTSVSSPPFSSLQPSASPSVTSSATSDNLENAVDGRKITTTFTTGATDKLATEEGTVDSKLHSGPSITPSPSEKTTTVTNKRPSSATIGIAAVRRNGLIRPESAVGALLPGMPPANKMPKLEGSGTIDEFGGMATNTNRGLLIGIATSSCSSINQLDTQPLLSIDNDQILRQQQCPQDMFRAAMAEKDLLQRVSIPSMAGPSSSQHVITPQLSQDQLQQAFSKNPELAINFHHSLATLYAIDPALAAKAAIHTGYAFPGTGQFGASQQAKAMLQSSSQKPSNDSSQKSLPLVDERRSVPQQLGDPSCSSSGMSSSTPASGLLLSPPSFPLGVSLASQLASLAAASRAPIPSTSAGPAQQQQQNQQSIVPFKNGRWCNMHATIAHQIAKHQEATKAKEKGIMGGGSKSAIGILRGSQQQQQRMERKTSSNATPMMTQSGGQQPQTQSNSGRTTTQKQGMLNSNNRGQQTPGCGNAMAMPGHAMGRSSTSSSTTSLHPTSDHNLQQQLALLMAASGGGIQSQQRLNEDALQSALFNRVTPAQVEFPGSKFSSSATAVPQQFLPPATPGSLGCASQLLSSSSDSASGPAAPPLFGGFPIQPPGPGAGSLTSGNSDAAAAAQLQQQAQLLNLLQQQHQQHNRSNPPLLSNNGTTAQLSLTNLLSQLGAPNANAFGAISQPSQLSGNGNNLLLSALIANNATAATNLALANILNPTALPSLRPQPSLLPSNSALSSLAAQFSTGNNTSSSLSSSNNDPPPGTESILAAFLSGQSLPFEPKISFPPSQLPAANNPLLNNASNSSGLGIEQLMLRSQFGAGNSLPLAAGRLPSSSATIPPPPSSLIAHGHHLSAGSSVVMNPIEQELLMRQMRFAGQPQLSQQFAMPNGTPPKARTMETITGGAGGGGTRAAGEGTRDTPRT